jgi:peptidoglycan/LPS O-acetylase OafA/YrhL
MLLRRIGIPEQGELIEVAVAVTLAIAAGGAFAWWRTRRWRATIAGALATLLLTVAMAGPVPIGRSSRAVWIFLAVLPVAVLAGGVLAVVVRYVDRTFVIPTELNGANP